MNFIKYLLVWISQNLSIPFWMVGHIHLMTNVYADIHEIIASIGMNIGKNYQTSLSESHRPDLQPNGKVVRCIEDKDNGYLVVKTDENVEPNIWLVHEKHLTELKTII